MPIENYFEANSYTSSSGLSNWLAGLGGIPYSVLYGLLKNNVVTFEHLRQLMVDGLPKSEWARYGIPDALVAGVLRQAVRSAKKAPSAEFDLARFVNYEQARATSQSFCTLGANQMLDRAPPGKASHLYTQARLNSSSSNHNNHPSKIRAATNDAVNVQRQFTFNSVVEI